MLEQEKVDELIAARTPESPTLEFKSTVPERSDKGRAEFLKDVSAFANAEGGTILYGIQEEKGEANKRSGLRLDDLDSEIRRLTQMLEAGIEPRLPSLTFQHLPSPDGDVLALHVPRSFDGPHRYHFNGHTKFVQRMNTHVSELSFDQLRSAFSRTSARVEKLRKQWNEDLDLSNTWRPLQAGAVCVVRLASIAGAEGRQLIDPKVAYENWSKLIFSDWMGGNSAFNYQGLVTYPSRTENPTRGLAQVNRYGSITAYDAVRVEWEGKDTIPAMRLGDFIVSAAHTLRSFALAVGLRGSALLNVALVRADGHVLGSRDGYGFDQFTAATTGSILTPDIWIEDLVDEGRVDPILQPSFDLLWQSFGRSHCHWFDENGMWKPR